jgi:TatA/E family protein of Tat protein translocase
MLGHLPELIIVLVLALIFFGPEKLPQMASDAGKMVRELRQAIESVGKDTELEDDDQFATYYQESLERSGETVDPADDVDYEDSEVDYANMEGESDVHALEYGNDEEWQPDLSEEDVPEVAESGAHPVAREQPPEQTVT